MKRTLLFTLLALVLALGLVACGGATEEPPVEEPPVEEPAAEEPVEEEPAEEPLEEVTEEPMEEPTEEPVEEATEEPAEEPAEEGAAAEGQIYLMGADGLLSATFYENVGEEGLGMYFTGPGQPETGPYEEFVAKYEETYGEAPIQAFHARAYDATNMVFNAIEQVAEDPGDGTLVIDRQALIEAMYQTVHEGLTGTLSCNEFGDCASPVISVYRYEDVEAGVTGVLANVQDTFSYELPETGVGVVPEAPGEDLGQVTIAAGAPIEIATLQAISGAVTNLGTDQVRAVEIAIADRGGELLGHPLQLSMNEDDLCSAEGGTTGAQRIIANPQIVAVIGTSCSGAGVPASEALSAAGILTVSGSNTAPALTATGYFSEEGPQRGEAWDYGYFRTAHNDEFQGRAGAQYVFETLGVTQAATINDGDPYTEGLTAAFGGSFEEFGGEVVLATAVGAEQEDMRPVLTEVAASGAGLVFFPIFEPAGNFIVLQTPDVGLEVIQE